MLITILYIVYLVIKISHSFIISKILSILITDAYKTLENSTCFGVGTCYKTLSDAKIACTTISKCTGVIETKLMDHSKIRGDVDKNEKIFRVCNERIQFKKNSRDRIIKKKEGHSKTKFASKSL